MLRHNRDPLRKLNVVYVPTESLKENSHKTRIHSLAKIQRLARSIDQFGFIQPVIIDSNNVIWLGVARYLAARRLGLNEIPTIQIDDLSDGEFRALSLADNRLVEKSKWDAKALAWELTSLANANLKFDLELTGFDTGEIDFYIQNLVLDSEEEGSTDLPTGPAVTRLGDLWECDEHRILCGSSLDRESFAKLMPDRRAAMVFTDPPYNVPINGHVSGSGKVRHREFAMASGEMTESQFQNEFILPALSHHAEFSRDGSVHFVCIDFRHVQSILAVSLKLFGSLLNICVWVKNNAGMGSFYRNQHELVCVFKKGKISHKNNVRLGVHKRNRSNVWGYPSATTFGKASEEGPLYKQHPTVKPVKLVADAILDCTSRGDIILDGFLGSGTTLIAAERTGRICYGIEIDPLYVDTAIRRWQVYTGRVARNVITGRLFDQQVGG